MTNETRVIDLPPVAAIPYGYRSIYELQHAGEQDERIGTAVAVGSTAFAAALSVANKLRGKDKSIPIVLAVGAAVAGTAIAAVLDGRDKQASAEFLRQQQAQGTEIITQ